MAQRFTDTSAGAGLTRLENLVGIANRDSSNLLERRNLINNRFKVSNQDFTLDFFTDSLCAAGIKALVMESADKKSILINILETLDPSLSISQIEHFVSMLVPAHLGWTLDYGKTDFNEYDSFDKSAEEYDNSDKTWNDFDLSEN